MKTQPHAVHPDESVQPSQSNHGVYRVPAGVTDLAALPLYLVVAHWGWRLGRPFNREEVAVAFGIPLRRAGDVMSYICRAGDKRIATRQHIEHPEKGRRLRYLAILTEPTRVGLPGGTRDTLSVTASPPAPPRVTEAALHELRQWFLGRPNPAGETNEA